MKEFEFSKWEIEGGYDSAKFLEELKKDSFAYAKIKELGLTNREVADNLSLLITYKDDNAVCKKCPGLENCPKSHQGYVIDIVKNEDGRLSRVMAQCPALFSVYMRSENFVYRDYPKEFEDSKYKGGEWKGSRANLLNAFSLAQKGKAEPFIYVEGEDGTGKSYLVSVLANMGADNGKKVAYVDCAVRLGEISSMYFKQTDKFQSAMDSLTDCDLLVLDNFGGEYSNDMMRDSIVYPLLSSRRSLKKPTIIVSDFSIDQIAEIYRGKSPIKGKKLQDLLSSTCKVVKLERSLQSELHR